MPISSFIEHILTELFRKTDNWRQIHKQTNLIFDTSNEVCLKNNVLRRKIITRFFFYINVFTKINTTKNTFNSVPIVIV